MPVDRLGEREPSGQSHSDVVAHLDRHARERPEAVAVVDEHGVWSYADLLAASADLARHLRDLGVRAGHVVSMQLPNDRSFVAAHLAVSRLGAVSNPLLMQYEAEQLAAILQDAKPFAAIVPARHRGRDYAATWQHLATLTGLPRTVCTLEKGRLQDHRRASDSGVDPLQFAAGPDIDSTPTLVIFTSGTVRAKGVVHTHGTLMYGLRALSEELKLPGTSGIWMPSPVCHGTGLQWGVRLSWFAGVPLILQDRWSGDAALDLLAAHPCHFTMSATTFLHDLSAAAARRASEIDLRYFVCAGAPIPPIAVERAAGLGLTVLPAYGMTEHFVSLLVRPGDPSRFRLTSDGRALAGTDAGVRSEDGTITVSPGSVGELVVRGPGVAIAYLHGDPLRGAEGWQTTGDLAEVVGDGYFRIVGRQKDIIIRGGLNIAPRAIEEVLLRHPAIADAAVVGGADERLGERICAVLVGKPTEALPDDAALRSFLTDAGLAKFMLPEAVWWTHELPKTASGKIRKDALRQMLTEGSLNTLARKSG